VLRPRVRPGQAPLRFVWAGVTDPGGNRAMHERVRVRNQRQRNALNEKRRSLRFSDNRFVGRTSGDMSRAPLSELTCSSGFIPSAAAPGQSEREGIPPSTLRTPALFGCGSVGVVRGSGTGGGSFGRGTGGVTAPAAIRGVARENS